MLIVIFIEISVKRFVNFLFFWHCATGVLRKASAFYPFLHRLLQLPITTHLIIEMHQIRPIMQSAEPSGRRCVSERPLGGAYRPVKKTLFHGALDTSLYRIWCYGKAARQRKHSLCHGKRAYHMLLMSRAFRGITSSWLAGRWEAHRGRLAPQRRPSDGAICTYNKEILP